MTSSGNSLASHLDDRFGQKFDHVRKRCKCIKVRSEGSKTFVHTYILLNRPTNCPHKSAPYVRTENSLVEDADPIYMYERITTTRDLINPILQNIMSQIIGYPRIQIP